MFDGSLSENNKQTSPVIVTVGKKPFKIRELTRNEEQTLLKQSNVIEGIFSVSF